MRFQAKLRRYVLLFSLFVLLMSVALSGLLSSRRAPAVVAFSCFTIATEVTCIDAVPAPISLEAAPIIVPVGADGEYQSDDITFEDDGGREVARG